MAQEYGKDPFHTRNKNFDSPSKNLAQLKDSLGVGYEPHKNYIQRIIDNYARLNCLKPSEIESEKREFDKFRIDLSQKINNTEFHELIIAAMRYEALREKDFLPYIKKLGIKSCVYCNAQLAIVVERASDDKLIGRLELDHHFPKSEYPFLCTSFFNLFPVCGNCNRLKSNDKIDFDLYVESTTENQNPFVFSLSPASIVKYLTDYNEDHLEINFNSKNDANALADNLDKKLCIRGIYDTQKDLAAELVCKSKIYTPGYRADLMKNFNAIFPDQALLNRIIIGSYDKAADIHKRPMSKFIQDIANQLHLK